MQHRLYLVDVYVNGAIVSEVGEPEAPGRNRCNRSVPQSMPAGDGANMGIFGKIRKFDAIFAMSVRDGSAPALPVGRAPAI